MGLVNWAAHKLGYGKIAPRRRFDGAKQTRTTFDFFQTSNTINEELRWDLTALRRRSRTLAQNEPLVRKFISLVGQNVVGSSGVRLQVRIKQGFGDTATPDKLANNALETAWKDWGQRMHCDVTGRMSFIDMSYAIIKTVARDGEALIRIHRGFGKYNYALQFLDIERLDTTLNRDGQGDVNAIVMGVEIDGNGATLAYHIIVNFFGKNLTAKKRERVPAEDIIHLYMTDCPEQLRGIPWMHASMLRIHHLKGYEDAALIAARIGASKMGFYKTPDGEAGTLAEGKDNEGVPFVEVDPGQFGIMPEGYSFETFDPAYPHAQYESFVKSAKRDVGSGLNIAYHAIANDLEGVNFSSIRSGTLEERDEWMAVQSWYIRQFFDRVYSDWVEFALLSSQVLMPNGSALPARKLTKFKQHEFMGRRWSWVDPKKDLEAAVIGMTAGVLSPFVVASNQGLDAEEVLQDIKRFQELAEEHGVKIGSPTPAAPATNEPDDDEPIEPEIKPKDKEKE